MRKFKAFELQLKLFSSILNLEREKEIEIKKIKIKSSGE